MSSSPPLNDELGGFSIGHVQSITSEPIDSQVSPFSFTVISSSSPLNDKILSLVTS